MYCPACGSPNPEGARFCRDCKAKLPEAARRTLSKEDQLISRPPPVPPKSPGISRLAIASLIMGILGLGIPAIIAAVFVLRDRRPGRGLALAGIVVGALQTIGLAVLLGSVLSGGDAILRSEITPHNAAAFISAVETRLDRLEQQAEELKSGYDPEASSELVPFYRLTEETRQLLFDMSTSDSPEDLNALREEVVSNLDEAKRLLLHQD